MNFKILLGFEFVCEISCIETVTHHISGQPFCTMSMESLEMIVKHAKSLFVGRHAKPGEV